MKNNSVKTPCMDRDAMLGVSTARNIKIDL